MYADPKWLIWKFLVSCKSSDLKPRRLLGVAAIGVQKRPVAEEGLGPKLQARSLTGVGVARVSFAATIKSHGKPKLPVLTMRCRGAAFELMNGYWAMLSSSNE